METIIIYPLPVLLDGNGIVEKIITEHDNKEWRKLLKELRKTFMDYDGLYGIKIRNVKKFKEDFIQIKSFISDKNKYSKYGNIDNLDETIIGFLNHDLFQEGRPSFYKDNTENNKLVDKFTVIFQE